MNYRTAAEKPPKPPPDCPLCHGPHDSEACYEENAKLAQAYAERAWKFAIGALVFAILALVFRIIGLGVKYHWFG